MTYSKSQILAIEEIDLDTYCLEKHLLERVSEEIIRQYKILPLAITEETIEIVMSDPFNLCFIDELERIIGKKIIAKKASIKQIEKIIYHYFPQTTTKQIVEEVEKRLKKEEEKEQKDSLKKGSFIENEIETSLTVKLVDHIILQAVQKRASDIHIEAMQHKGRIRYRIDGYLQEEVLLPMQEFYHVVTRIKILGNLNIAEKRIPQDGRMEILLENRLIDMRISVLPTLYGEKVTIRLIYMKDFELTLEDLGFTLSDRVKFNTLLKKPNGILLLTGPTGSGKSTTLATILKSLNKKELNIVTVEDPIENKIEGVNQVAIHPKAGLTFSSTLRGVLRQDPDIIMIGEMRDKETSTIAMRAAITGHLVLSTLHTNDAVGSMIRLLDMGVEPFMVSAAIQGVIAQRLVRKLCPFCKTSKGLTLAEKEYLEQTKQQEIYQSNGCTRCNYTGYQGRKAVHELFVMDDLIREAITNKKISHKKLFELAKSSGMRTLKQNMTQYVLSGETDLEEMYKIMYQ